MKIIKNVLRIISLIAVSLLGMLLLFYFMAPVYQLAGSSPFAGNKLYNPYEGMKAEKWKKYSFKVQSHAYAVFVKGNKNPNKLIDSIYNVLGYDYVATSDAQHINTYNSNKPYYIPTYEHGYNFLKTNQLCIGSDEVLWIDLLFFQTTGMKQWIIDRLRPHNEIIALNPNSYTYNNLKNLIHYDLMEITGNFQESVSFWDTTLSAGQPAFILADDDAGDADNLPNIGSRFTMINADGTNRREIISALKSGNAYGVDFKLIPNESLSVRAQRAKLLPYVNCFELNSDTMVIKTSAEAAMIRFIRQGGEVVENIISSDSASYVVKPDDRYVRTEIKLKDGTTFYLNPVIRYNGDKLESKIIAKTDVNATGWLRLFYFALPAFLFWYFTRKLPGKKSKEDK